MKVVFTVQKNNSSQPQKQNVVFGAGLTPKMMQEIQQSDVLGISSRLAKKGIPTDFKGYKAVAWCYNKTIQIFEYLNKEYKFKIPLPKGIKGEDFEELSLDKMNMLSFCTTQPAIIRKNSNIITPERTIFFNTLKAKRLQVEPNNQWMYDWNHIDEISDLRYLTKQSATDFFLDLFFNENIHSYQLHELKSKLGTKALLEIFKSVQDEKQMEMYRKKYGSQVSKICDHALESPFEAIACDMSRVIAESLDPETLMPTRNPFIGTSYERLSFLQRADIPDYSDEERPLKEILRNFWNGKFE